MGLHHAFLLVDVSGRLEVGCWSRNAMDLIWTRQCTTRVRPVLYGVVLAAVCNLQRSLPLTVTVNSGCSRERGVLYHAIFLLCNSLSLSV